MKRTRFSYRGAVTKTTTILNFVADHPYCLLRDVVNGTGFDVVYVSGVLGRAVAAGDVDRTGSRGSYRFSIPWRTVAEAAE